MDVSTQQAVQAAVFQRLVDHLAAHPEAQNIDLMLLADFCRNCLAKWYSAAAEELGESVDYESARELIYGMPYSEWKANHQLPATPEQMAAFEAKRKAKAGAVNTR